ncbi:PAS domain-containing sensor histidine kinase [Parabacteroides sp. OttesenSCG-928-N08]|nr:PAS domain-containing sensor histidine kinase [Parabacteroides sp. OttesenSCG-928-N08]
MNVSGDNNLLHSDTNAAASNSNDVHKVRQLSKIALKAGDIRTGSIFLNPQSNQSPEDSTVVLNSWKNIDEEGHRLPWKEFEMMIHPDERARYLKELKKLCRGEMTESRVEARMRDIENQTVHIWRDITTIVYERDKKGRPTILICSATEIEMRKSQEQALEMALDKAEAADRMKSKYLADMSHEIRTPLNAITGFAELMAFADSDEERLSYYEIIKTNNQLLMQLINDILDLSKIEADAIKIAYEMTDVNDLMDSVYASARLRMRPNVTLICNKGADECVIGADPIRLMQLLNNLLNNAIKNTHGGSITMGYTVEPDGRLRFYVADTGIGIAKEKLENMFGRFVKLNDYVEGIGLGLAICSGLVTTMGGSIHVTSELGVGSEFFFFLPSHADEVEPIDEE